MKTSVLDFLDLGAKQRAPERLWVVDGETSWTLEQFDQLSRRMGSGLIAGGIQPLEVVSVFLPNGAWMLAADFAILRAGAAFLNLDTTLPVVRLAGLLGKVKPTAIITDAANAARLRQAYKGLILDLAQLGAHAIDQGALEYRRANATDVDPACLITTSGSTGVPKAVALTHRGLIDFGEWFDSTFDFGERDVVGSLSPLFFDGYVPGLLMSLYRGGRFVILPREVAAFPVRLVEQLRAHGITFIFWVPSTLTPLAKLGALDRLDLPALRFVGFAGEVMPPPTLSYLMTRIPKAIFVNFYGPIEISVICTYFVVPNDYTSGDPVPIGFACANSTVLILNADNQVCRPNEHGELCVRGACVALGYWNDPEKTSERFVPNPLQPAYKEIIYRTGDIAFRDDQGVIHFVGRQDLQIKHQGYRIDLAEIEHVLGTTLGISVLCVLYDSDRKNIIVFYDDEQHVDLGDVRRAIADKLPKHMHPHSVRKCSPMPLNPNGKIDRVKLQDQLTVVSKQ